MRWYKAKPCVWFLWNPVYYTKKEVTREVFSVKITLMVRDLNGRTVTGIAVCIAAE